MIDTSNNFYIPNLKNIVFLGYSKALAQMQSINLNLKIKDIIVTSSDQKKYFKKEKNIFVFDRIDSKFKNFIRNKFNISQTLFISIGCRWIFKKETIEKFFKFNLINFHGTRLPYDAGGGAYSWNILRNDRINNLVAHIIEPGIDKGKIIINEKSIFPPHCKIPLDFEEYYLSKLVPFYQNFIFKVKNGSKFSLKEQVNYIGRYNPRLSDKLSGWINWQQNSLQLCRFINAFDDPYCGAMTMIKGQKVFIKKVHLHGGETTNHPFMTGLISRHDKKWLVVSTVDENMLLIESVLNSKQKNIIGLVSPGERFYTPYDKLDSVFSKKIIYDTKGLKIK